MEIKKAAHAYFEKAILSAVDNFDKKDWEITWKIVDEAENYDKEKFAIPEFQRLVIATSIFALQENKENVADWNAEELELFSIGFAYDKFSAYSNNEDFSFKPKMKRFDKEVLDAILSKKLSKREAMDFIWNIDEQLYETGLSKEEVLKFVNSSDQKAIGQFLQSAYQKDLKFLEEHEKEVEKLCL